MEEHLELGLLVLHYSLVSVEVTNSDKDLSLRKVYHHQLLITARSDLHSVLLGLLLVPATLELNVYMT